jgi:hypothetical protein
MTNPRSFWLLAVAVPAILAILVLAGCSSDDDDGPTTPPADTDQEVLDDAWAGFEGGDLATAGAKFRELLGRGTMIPVARDGLGWTFAVQNEADSSLVHFAAALAAGADTLAIADQAQAGLAFASAAALEFQDCLDASAQVSTGWVFAHDDRFDHDQVVLLAAGAHYALGDFAASLAAVQQLDAGFTADIGTVEGRAALAARIEQLQA